MSDRIQIVDDRFMYAGKDYGPADTILAYPGEEKHLGLLTDVTWGHRTPQDIDLIFAVGEKVAGAEVKLPLDLVSSWYSKRLPRQLHTMRETVDISVLVLRDGLDVSKLAYTFWEYTKHLPPKHRKSFDTFLEDLINVQTLGVYLLHVPRVGYINHIVLARRALVGNGYRAIAGSDQTIHERRPGWLLRRIPHIGAKRSLELIRAYGTSWGTFQAAMKGKSVSTNFGPAIQRSIKNALEE